MVIFQGPVLCQTNIESVASFGAPYFVISFIAISRGFCGHDLIAALTELLLTWTDDMLDGFFCATAKKKALPISEVTNIRLKRYFKAFLHLSAETSVPACGQSFVCLRATPLSL